MTSIEAQLARRDELLRADAERVGWKLGRGERERIGAGPVVGYLTTEALRPSGGAHSAAGAPVLHADAELAVLLDRDLDPAAPSLCIRGHATAFELVGLDAGEDAQTIVAGNVFHRAVGELGRVELRVDPYTTLTRLSLRC